MIKVLIDSVRSLSLWFRIVFYTIIVAVDLYIYSYAIDLVNKASTLLNVVGLLLFIITMVFLVIFVIKAMENESKRFKF